MSNLGNKDIMAKNIQYYMDINDKTRQDVCTALGFKYTTYTDWINANTYPRIDKIEMMADYFGIEKSDLIEERKEPLMVKEGSSYYTNNETRRIAQEIFEDNDMQLLFDLKKGTQADRLMDYARYLKEQHDKENGL